MEKDDEVKGGGNSYDFGARMFDSRVGRWLTIDALTGKYPSISPFIFVTNSPLIFVDPDGKDIIAKSKETQEMIKFSVTPEEAKYFKFNRNGKLNTNKLKRGEKKLGEISNNYKSYLIVADNKLVTEYYISTSYSCLNRDGKITTKEFGLAPTQLEVLWKESGGDESGESLEEYSQRRQAELPNFSFADAIGNIGITLVPFNLEFEKIESFSLNNNIQVYINENAIKRAKSSTIAHETVAHVSNYVQNLDFTHGNEIPGTPWYKPNVDGVGRKAEIEAEKNFDLHHGIIQETPKEDE